jgi:ferredoxin--NADP+ reductase
MTSTSTSNVPTPGRCSAIKSRHDSTADLPTAIDEAEVLGLRKENYNATLGRIIEVHEDLRILRVVPDGDLPPIEPGQFVSLGLGNWEARVAGVDEEHLDRLHLRRLTQRAYSLSCSMLDEGGRLRRAAEFPYLEIYVALVRHADKRPPSLTPRLFALQTGNRLFVERHFNGHYTLESVRPTDDVFFFATGTGEAPHNAMIAELLARGHPGRIVNTVSVRLKRDAAYRSVHEELVRRFSDYRYFLLTTREPENLDPTRDGFVGKRHLQDHVRSGSIERETGVPLDPATARVFLCGNPAMIGLLHAAHQEKFTVAPGSMLDLLHGRGFRTAQPDGTGNVHFERYW